MSSHRAAFSLSSALVTGIGAAALIFLVLPLIALILRSVTNRAWEGVPGVLLARERDDSAPELLRDGAAAGAANAVSGGGGRFDKATFDEIRAQTVVTRM